jgi:hypothetical protein
MLANMAMKTIAREAPNTGSRRQRLCRWWYADLFAELRDNGREFGLPAAAPEPIRWAAQG